ncbi:unnamed protein product [marine sediment metagenome]|uniref:Uncharacterized protein n=1 Tax=marine sediment metagenome TaxID=412755 RepID=X1B8Y4_9ZZZZ
MSNKWQKDFPRESGYYWFYGWLWMDARVKISPKWSLVEVKNISNGICWVTEGNFIYPRENHVGLFCKVEFPEPPDLGIAE